MSYENRHDSRKDPTAECPDVPCGPFKATDCAPGSFIHTDWCVTAEGDVYGLMLRTEEDAKAWAAALNSAYEAGYDSGQHDLISTEKPRNRDDCAKCLNAKHRPDCGAWRHTALSDRCANYLENEP